MNKEDDASRQHQPGNERGIDAHLYEDWRYQRHLEALAHELERGDRDDGDQHETGNHQRIVFHGSECGGDIGRNFGMGSASGSKSCSGHQSQTSGERLETVHFRFPYGQLMEVSSGADSRRI